MWKVWRVVCAASAMAWGGGGGCATGDDPDFVGMEAFCDGACRAVARCRALSSVVQCRERCLTDVWDEPAMSDGAGVVFGACLAGLSCSDLESQEAFDACWEAGKEDVAVTPRTREFCAGYSSQSFECGYSYPTAECELDFRMWADDVLEQVELCYSVGECTARERCFSEVFS